MAIDFKAQSLLDDGRYEDTYEYLLETGDASADSEEILYLLGMTAPSGRSLSPYLKEYIQRYPKGKYIAPVRQLLADYYSAQGLNITASKIYPESPSSRDYDPSELYRLALYRQQTGEYQSAIDIYGIVLTEGDSILSDWARLGISDCHLQEGKIESAIEGYKAMIDEGLESPLMPFAYLGLSNAYLRAGKADKAQKYFDTYRHLYPNAGAALELDVTFAEQEQEQKHEQVSQKITKAINAGYFIQVGVFSRKDNAKACVRKFRNLGYQARMGEFKENGQSFQRVLLGPYDNEQSARRAKGELEKSQGEEYIIFIE